jgi:hypothetical protein
MTRTLETARGALPPPPADWVLVGDDRISVPSSFCMDRPAPFTYAYGRTYGNRSPRKQQANEQATADAAALAQADLARKQPKIDALMARMATLNQQAVAAMQTGDQAKAESINREIEKVGNDLTKLLDQGNPTAQIEAASAQSLRDIEMHITVRANPAGVTVPAGAKSVAKPEGASAALRWSTEHEGVMTGHAVLLIGAWKQKPAVQGWSPAAIDGAPAVTPGWYAVEIDADPGRLDALVRGVDVASLAATVSR